MEKTKEDEYINYKISPHVLNVLKLMERLGHISECNRQIASENKDLKFHWLFSMYYFVYLFFLSLVLFFLLKQ